MPNMAEAEEKEKNWRMLLWLETSMSALNFSSHMDGLGPIDSDLALFMEHVSQQYEFFMRWKTT